MFYTFLVSCWYITVFKFVFLLVLWRWGCLYASVCLYISVYVCWECVCLCVYILFIYVFVCMCVCCTFYAFWLLIFSLFLHSTLTFLCSLYWPVYLLKRERQKLGGWVGESERKWGETVLKLYNIKWIFYKYSIT